MIRLYLLSAGAALWAGACGNDLGVGFHPDAGSPDGDVSLASNGSGLPCEVSAILADHCQTCHGAKPANGAPFPLVTYRDLTIVNPGGIVIAQRALIRMTNAASPMPPSPGTPLPATDIAVFERWANGGTPTSMADCKGPPGPFDGPPVCTSGMTWPGGEGAPVMHPGFACITCHAQSGGSAMSSVVPARHGEPPQLTIAGTVYPTGHEPNDCDGATTAAVEIADANGAVTQLPVNAAGNFLTTSPIAFPIHVAVVANGKRRAMVSSPPLGDCNHCHTQDGINGAPGRIVLP